jgi:hypothetical protein
MLWRLGCLIGLFLLQPFYGEARFRPDFSGNNRLQDLLLPKIQPLMLWHPNTPGLALGLELRPLRSIAIQGEYTLPFYALAFYNNNQGRIDQDFLRLRQEIRFYPNPDEEKEFYYALEFRYDRATYHRLNSLLIQDDKVYNYIRSDISRVRMGFAAKFGYQFVVADWLMIDAFGGLGLSNRELIHRPDQLFEVPVTREQARESGSDIEAGKQLQPLFFLGVRIGFSLYQRY